MNPKGGGIVARRGRQGPLHRVTAGRHVSSVVATRCLPWVVRQSCSRLPLVEESRNRFAVRGVGRTLAEADANRTRFERPLFRGVRASIGLV